MRIASCFMVVFCVVVVTTDEASAASRRQSNGHHQSTRGQRAIEPNERFFEYAINSRVGRNASQAARYFAYLTLSGR